MPKVESKDLGIIDLDITDIDGIGDIIAKKIKHSGINSVMELAVTTSDELSELIKCSKDLANDYILSAQKLLRETHVLDKEFMTTRESLDRRKNLLKCTTGSKDLNTLLLGGIETQAITEFFGEYGSGKSQICHTVSVLATQKIENGGLDSRVIYLDTEGTYRPERIRQIAESRELDIDHVIDSIEYCKIYNSGHLELIINNLSQYVEEKKAKLVILDSATSLHRAEFIGRGTLADRQQRLNHMLHKLVRITEIYNIAIIMTNQVMADPSIMFGDPMRAIGGHVLGHTATYRIKLTKSSGNRIATVIDSPYHEYSSCTFTLNKKGVDDISEDDKKKKKKKDDENDQEDIK